MKRARVDESAKKKIFRDDKIYAAVSKAGGWYISFTTLDPEEKFKSRFVSKIAGPPPEKYVETTDYMGDKPKHWLIKEKVNNEMKKYGYTIVDEPSPWRPKAFGESSDEEEEETPVAKPSSDLSKIEEKIKENHLLLQEIAALLRLNKGKDVARPVVGDDLSSDGEGSQGIGL